MPTKPSQTSFTDAKEKRSRSGFFFVKVRGESAWPELVPGKKYLAASFLKPSIGDFIVFKNPANPSEIFVKKILSEWGGTYEVSGIVPWSSSSADFGPVPASLVIGKIILSSLLRF